MAYIESLITSVKQRPCIWDYGRQTSHDRSLVKAAWEEVAYECGLDARTARTKWKGLRDTYRYEMKKQLEPSLNRRKRGGPKWNWYAKLHFIRPSLRTRQHSRYIMSNADTNSRKDPTNSQEASMPQLMSTSTGDGGDESKPFPLVDVVDSAEEPTQQNNESAAAATESYEEYDFGKDKDIEMEKNVDAIHDSCYHFALSLVPTMRKLSTMSQLRCQIRIQELLLNELEERNNPPLNRAVSEVLLNEAEQQNTHPSSGAVSEILLKEQEKQNNTPSNGEVADIVPKVEPCSNSEDEH